MEDSGPSTQSNSSSASRRASAFLDKGKERKRVEFSNDTDSPGLSPHQLPRLGSSEPSPGHSRTPSGSNVYSSDIPELDISDHDLSMEIHKVFGQPYVPKPKSAIRKNGTITPLQYEINDGDQSPQAYEEDNQKLRSGLEAQKRAERLAKRVGSYSSASNSRKASVEIATSSSSGQGGPEDIPLQNISLKGDHTSETRESTNGLQSEARRLVRLHTVAKDGHCDGETPLQSGQVTPVAEQDYDVDYVPKPRKYRGGILSTLMKLYNSSSTQALQAGLGGHSNYSEFAGGDDHEGFRRPSADLTLEDRHDGTQTPVVGTDTAVNTPQHSPPHSGTTTPRQIPLRSWFSGSRSQSAASITPLIASSSVLASPVQRDFGEEVAERLNKSRPDAGKRTRSGNVINSAIRRMSKPRLDDQFKITVHIAETMARQRYLVKLCKALMQYGAPTHRLEEYMKMSSRVLEIESQFLYMPGCMIISFDDSTTHTAEVKLVRTSQGVDLGKLRDTHEIYKEVLHDRVGVKEATKRLERVMERQPKYKPWVLVFVYGLASAAVGPFAFQARLIDLPMAFVLGSVLGFLQLIVAPRSETYSNVFEITAAIITSFLARALGSIGGGNLFCFSALAQSSIALILPGYTVLCASLELQSRSMVAGSVRMVYAIIYSLFLGFGITIGTATYGVIDHNATSATTCQNPMPDYHFFPFVPAFTLCLIVINQAKWRQAPVMMIIAFAGYLVNFFSSRRFVGNTQVSNTLGALAIGFLANMYSRLGQRFDNKMLSLWERRIRPCIYRLRGQRLQRPSFLPTATSSSAGSSSSSSSATGSANTATYNPKAHKRRVGYGLAAASMLPAIFVQVPSGLAVSGSLVSGITSANQITGNATGTTVVASGDDAAGIVSVGIAFNVGYSVIQVAIGITVGLFLSALIVYPMGKRRSGLFSF